MSEDVDYKMVPLTERSLNSTAARRDVSAFRKQILETLAAKTGFAPEPDQIIKGNNNTFTKVLLDYPSVYQNHPILRSKIKLEFTALSSFTASEKKPVTSLMHEVMGDTVGFKSVMIDCVSIHETAAEKLIAICRRIASADRFQKIQNRWLVRHLYDLHCIEKEHGLSEQFERLIPPLLSRDMHRAKSADLSFFENPMTDLSRGLELLSHNPEWVDHYNSFLRNMVFQKEPPTFRQAISTLENLHGRAMKALQTLDLSDRLKRSYGDALEDKSLKYETGRDTQTLTRSELEQFSEGKSLEVLLKIYIEMELETTRLVNRLHVMRAKGEAGAADASIAMLANVEVLSDFSASTMKHEKISEIISFLEKQPKRYNAPTLASLGGFKGIYERIEKEPLTQEEIHVLAGQLKDRAGSCTRTLQQKQNKHRGGGRSR